MPNLRPPITTTAAAMAYRQLILKALPKDSSFTPLMTLYLTDTTSPNEIKLASESVNLLIYVADSSSYDVIFDNLTSRFNIIVFDCLMEVGNAMASFNFMYSFT